MWGAWARTSHIQPAFPVGPSVNRVSPFSGTAGAHRTGPLEPQVARILFCPLFSKMCQTPDNATLCLVTCCVDTAALLSVPPERLGATTRAALEFPWRHAIIHPDIAPADQKPEPRVYPGHSSQPYRGRTPWWEIHLILSRRRPKASTGRCDHLHISSTVPASATDDTSQALCEWPSVKPLTHGFGPERPTVSPAPADLADRQAYRTS